MTQTGDVLRRSLPGLSPNDNSSAGSIFSDGGALSNVTQSASASAEGEAPASDMRELACREFGKLGLCVSFVV